MESKKNMRTALVLCVVLGGGGFHRFYVGKWRSGLIYMLTGGIFGIGIFIDLVNMFNGRFTDKYGFVLQD